MKKIILIIIVFFVFSSSIFAVETSTPSAKQQDLMDRLTTKVAELSNQLRRTYWGKVKSTGTSSISLSTPEGDRTITTNDVTTYFRIRSGNRTEINFSGLKTGDDIVGTGTVDPQNNEMTARQIIAKIQRYNLAGTITEINKSIIAVQDFSGKIFQIDFSDAIALKKTDVAGKISVAKFSDFQKGSLVFVMGYFIDATTQEYSVLKALVYLR